MENDYEKRQSQPASHVSGARGEEAPRRTGWRIQKTVPPGGSETTPVLRSSYGVRTYPGPDHMRVSHGRIQEWGGHRISCAITCSEGRRARGAQADVDSGTYHWQLAI